MTTSLFRFASKATTLERLSGSLATARLCPQIIVSASDWRERSDQVVAGVVERFAGSELAVRSSAVSEDGWDASNAGAYESLIHVACEPAAVHAAVTEVFASYTEAHADDQVLVQPMVGDVVIAGVVLTRDLDTGSPYYVINYDDFSGRTDTVTGGAESKAILVYRSRPDALHSPRFRKLMVAVREIEAVTNNHELDIEFCVTRSDDVFILQVRPLAARKNWDGPGDGAIDNAVGKVREHLAASLSRQDSVAGETTVFGEMPDWNPAEMIGTTPRPLSLSLYKTLITDRTWAEARALMGYRPTLKPLMVDFQGRPFIDTRLSFNSFLPANLPDDLAETVVNSQIALLKAKPDLHDKIEFAIASTVRDFAFADGRARLAEAGLSAAGINVFEEKLATTTAGILAERNKGVATDLALARSLLTESCDDPADGDPRVHARALLERCRRCGTLPFSKLARHGFVGVLFLKSLVARGALTPQAADHFMHSIHTVAADLVLDMHALGAGSITRAAFLRRYGHLRPGTYDVLSYRYDEQPDLYLSSVSDIASPRPSVPFALSSEETRAIEMLISEAGYDLGAVELLDYIRAAVKAREEAKFAFTRSVSDALAMMVRWGEAHGLSRDDLSFLPIDILLNESDHGRLAEAMAKGREQYALTRSIRLPHLIAEPEDIEIVRLPLGQPTFITNRSITAPIIRLAVNDLPDINGRIVMIESADPGFDWVFSHPIAGLITKYGGANSHMAIRCAEFSLPAAIGCGERLFETLAKNKLVTLNCGARTLQAAGH